MLLKTKDFVAGDFLFILWKIFSDIFSVEHL